MSDYFCFVFYLCSCLCNLYFKNFFFSKDARLRTSSSQKGKKKNNKQTQPFSLQQKIRKEIQETFSVQMHYVQVVLNKFTVPT